MTDAPERIWAEMPDLFDGMGFWMANSRPGLVEYIRADLASPLGAVVKPLVWEQYEGNIFCAKTPWGCYFAQWDDEIGAFFASLELGDHDDPIIIQPQDVASLSEAQAAAKADYTARILAALEPQDHAALLAHALRLPEVAAMVDAAMGVIARWDSPDWKSGHTLDHITKLRTALAPFTEAKP